MPQPSIAGINYLCTNQVGSAYLNSKTMNFIKKTTSLLLFALLSHDPVLCQGFLKNTFVTGGIALSGQDRRLFYSPDAEGIIQREKSKGV